MRLIWFAVGCGLGWVGLNYFSMNFIFILVGWLANYFVISFSWLGWWWWWVG